MALIIRKVMSKKNESKQVGLLYHVCTLEAYIKYIRQNDTLSSSGKWYNSLYGSYDYISFTRDPRFVADVSTADDIIIQLVVDGDKLSERYKVGPYNDRYDGDDDDDDHLDDASLREKEEAVKGPIKNISKYIKEIRVDFLSMDSHILDRLEKSGLIEDGALYFPFLKEYATSRKILSYLKAQDVSQKEPLNVIYNKLKEYVFSEDITDFLFSDDIKDVKSAIKKGVDLNRDYGELFGYPLNYAIDTCNKQMISLLSKSGAKVHITVDFNPFVSLMDNDAEDLIHYIVKHGVDPNLIDPYNNGNPPISLAIIFGNDAAFNKLIKLPNINLNIKNKDGDTPLMLAAKEDDKDMVQKLLKAGADPTIK